MAIATAICSLLLGLAVALLGLKKAVALQRALVAACFGLSLVALCGYLYEVKSLYTITSLSHSGRAHSGWSLCGMFAPPTFLLGLT